MNKNISGDTVLHNINVIVKNEKIYAVTDNIQNFQEPFDRIIDCTDKVLMPGLVNAHTHVPMTPLRGYGGGHDLQTWLNDYIFPAEDKLDSRCIRAATSLAMAELIQSGCTCINDMYYFNRDMIEEIVKAGLNANISRGTTCFSPIDNPENYTSVVEMRDCVENFNNLNNGQIKTDVSIHGEYTSFNAPNLWEYLAKYACDNKIGMHVHISETKSEHLDCIKRHNATPLQTLDKYGVWDCGRSVAAHCVWIDECDMDLMARKNISCAHNPVSNLKLGSGVAPVTEMLRHNVNVALATDGVSSNNNHDMFEELKLSSILHCGVDHNAMAVTPMQSLEMATVNGAKALGRKTGAIIAGYDADIILVDFNKPNLIPCHSIVENLVYSARGSEVCFTMAHGKILYENGELLTVNLDEVKYEMNHYVLNKMF